MTGQNGRPDIQLSADRHFRSGSKDREAICNGKWAGLRKWKKRERKFMASAMDGASGIKKDLKIINYSPVKIENFFRMHLGSFP